MRKTSLVISKTYNESFLKYGFALISENNEHCPLCSIRKKALASESLKPAKLKHLYTKHDFHRNSRVTIFSLPKSRTFFDNNYYQPYNFFCKAGKIFLDICWTLTAFDNYSLIISTNTVVYFLS